MTEEELIKRIFNYLGYCDSSVLERINDIIYELYEQNVVIPKGKNRHPYADVLHEWAENGGELTYRVGDSNVRYVIYDECIDFCIKPKEPVYEWQWYRYSEEDGKAFLTNEFYTEKEAGFELMKGYKKIEETKRERKQ